MLINFLISKRLIFNTFYVKDIISSITKNSLKIEFLGLMQNRCMRKCLKYNIPSINIIVLAKKWGRCVCVCEHNPPSPPQYFPGNVSRRPLEDEIFLLTLQSLRTPKVYHKSWLQRHLLLLSTIYGDREGDTPLKQEFFGLQVAETQFEPLWAKR